MYMKGLPRRQERHAPGQGGADAREGRGRVEPPGLY